MTLSSRSDLSLVSSSAQVAALARLCRSRLSNCRNRGAVLCCTSILSASARRTASCHLFRISVTSCRRASSRIFASRSLARSLFSRSDSKSLCSFFSFFDSSCFSNSAPRLACSTSVRSSLFSALSSFTCCSRDRFAVAFRWHSSFRDKSSASSLTTWLSPFRADAKSSLVCFSSASSEAIFSRALSFDAVSASSCSLKSLVSTFAARTAFSISLCLCASFSPSSRKAAITSL
mmetsp:Transcript_20121/g.36520  ORF Transcript_20121/g.36520 Transcript_20121/m.36520 type:complete len:233 (-) Transcript_20121:702-1400(-)